MSLAYSYADAYLAPLITPEREARASAEVSAIGALPAEWVDRLVVLRTYVITCVECQKAQDDTFGAKLSAYRKEYAETLQLARAAQAAINAGNDSGSGSGSFWTVPLERS